MGQRALTCALATLASACLAPQLVPCGDKLCANGNTCVADRCASADQLAACAGAADGATCTLGGGVGRCEGGACVPTGCGNGVLDPGEVCDDGNTISGDGCRGDCLKIEVCGDGIVDANEQCDDGNTNPADGCDACVLTTWRATAVIGGNLNATTVGIVPFGIAADRDGNLYISDVSNRVLRVDPTGTITTVAGDGTPGFSGDGGAAGSAQLQSPNGIAIDGLGNLYIADGINRRIRRVDPTGIITTVAGNGTGGFGGDGGAATSAPIGQPYGVAVDGLGNLMIADIDTNRVRRVDLTGVITTVAGNGTYGTGGDGGAATSAQLASPATVAADGLGNVFISDDSSLIRRVDPSGVITTFAGGGTSGLGDGGAATSAQIAPRAVAVDGLGNVFIADDYKRIRRVDSTGIITTVAGNGTQGTSGDGGAATSAELFAPAGVAVRAPDTFYILEPSRIRRVTAGIITTAAGNGTSGYSGDGGAATSAHISGPSGISVDSLGNCYIADANDERIRRVDPTGVITTVAGDGTFGYSGDGGAATSAQLRSPRAIAIDALGNLFIVDSYSSRIRRVDPTGVITTVAGDGIEGYSGDGGPATDARIWAPTGIALDGLGGFYIADPFNESIRRVNAAGIITTIAGSGTAGYSGDGGAATSAQLSNPTSVAVDGLGNVYVADNDNCRVRRVAPNGIITTVAGIGTVGSSGDGGPATAAQLSARIAVAVDSAGELYIADELNSRIRRVDAAGIITTVAGTGTLGASGDGGAAIGAVLQPGVVAFEGHGNLYLTDVLRVRRISASGVITTVAGAVDPERMGPLAQARLTDPRALVLAPAFTLFAAGSSGAVQAARNASARLEVVAGRYAQDTATASLARFRDQSFGDVRGVAYDAVANVIYMAESSANRIHVVTIVDAADAATWTIAPLAGGVAGFADGAASTARFRDPTGLYLDASARVLYVADSGNHVVRAIDLASATVRTVVGTPQTRGFFGDGGAATSALLFEPQAITRCANGDLFIADTGNDRVRRVAGGVISTVLGDGVPASSGEGSPATDFPVNAPLGLACDVTGNLFVTSTTVVRLVPADANGIVDGSGGVQTIYGAPPRTTFPASVTTCLTGLAIADATTVDVLDSCTGLLVELHRQPR